ncbi:MAG TPA: hypothetical protein VMR45_02950 [Patescibacteria group bacterium]|nr:hypothetical protein [Patescibacteria group bacterium]
MIIVASAISAAGGIWYHHLHRYIPGKITFQEYAPEYLPTGMSITQKTIEAWYIPAGWPARYTGLRLQLKDGSSIYQEENARNFMYACAATAENETCSVGITPRGQRYVLTAYTLQGQTKKHSVEWLEGKTDVIFVLDSTNGDGHSQETLKKS